MYHNCSVILSPILPVSCICITTVSSRSVTLTTCVLYMYHTCVMFCHPYYLCPVYVSQLCQVVLSPLLPMSCTCITPVSWSLTLTTCVLYMYHTCVMVSHPYYLCPMYHTCVMFSHPYYLCPVYVSHLCHILSPLLPVSCLCITPVSCSLTLTTCVLSMYHTCVTFCHPYYLCPVYVSHLCQVCLSLHSLEMIILGHRD